MRNSYSGLASNAWVKYMVSHGWHGCEGLSEGCMGLGMFVMGSLGETVCQGGLSAMDILVWQSNVWVKYTVCHEWHGREGLSEGCMGRGMFAMVA